MLCVPAVRPLVLHCAVGALTVPPVNTTALQPAIDVPPSVKLTVPIGAVPFTVAVKVTLTRRVEGLSELTSAVVVGGSKLHVGNLNEPIRVCQLPLVPFA